MVIFIQNIGNKDYQLINQIGRNQAIENTVLFAAKIRKVRKN